MFLKVDQREKDDELYDAVFELCEAAGIEVVDENQDIGDYVWYNDDGSHTGIVIEYKGMPSEDFFKSLQSGHLDTQILDLAQYPHPFLLIGGRHNPKQFRHKLTRRQVIAKLASVGMRTQVKPYWFNRVTDVAQFIMEAANQLQKGEQVDIIAHRHSKTRNRQDHNLNQFLALPTIGAKRATALCEEYKLFYTFLSAVVDGKVTDLPKGARDYVAAITGVNVDDLVPELEKWTSIPGVGKASAEKYIEQGLTIDQFISRVDGGIISVGIKTKRWVEDEVRKRVKNRKL